jgi:hypothetical protein
MLQRRIVKMAGEEASFRGIKENKGKKIKKRKNRAGERACGKEHVYIHISYFSCG